MKSYIQPFERVLALRELRAAAMAEPRHLGLFEETSTDFEVLSAAQRQTLASRLAYWETVEQHDGNSITLQSLRESTTSIAKNGSEIPDLEEMLPFGSEVPFPNRRCLRYGPHGIHEYRGKFFPQLVRSLINISGTCPGGVVADPMSGSGTTAVEALLSGCSTVGLDMNPLSVFLGRTKCQLLSEDPIVLKNAYLEIFDRLSCERPRKRNKLAYFSTLPNVDQHYLNLWFSKSVLAELDEISVAIESIGSEGARNLMRVSLSNIIRSVSWQKEDDLRVRKEVRLDSEIDTKSEFLEELSRSVRSVLAFLYQNGPVSSGMYSLAEGDARACSTIWSHATDSVDVVITSPPYATALPYLDTDRLSLCYLRLLSRSAHRRRDETMIGNREVTDRIRREYWTRFERDKDILPESVQTLVRTIDRLNAGTDVGFRRKNLPALLSKYFFDMQEVFLGAHRLLKPGGWAFVVVGNNHTIAGGKRIEIHTAKLLADIVRMLNFEVFESLSMEMLVSRDIFKRNALASEEILAFRKPTW
jgi:site-specific DNA-methyltransferase (cytosine-N4-specific)